VGNHQRFQPGALAKKLADFGVVNIGAAGTFVVRKTVSEPKLRAEILRHLSFAPELMICPARDLLALAGREQFKIAPPVSDASWFVSILQKTPRLLPSLPLDQPAGKQWQVRVMEVTGKFAVSLWRKHDKLLLYPNAVVEKQLGVSATTRNWNTIVTMVKILSQKSAA
jgi:uncharacterized protein (DUF1697 family)